MKIFQLYYSDSCLPHLQEGFIPRKNINPDPNSFYRENLDIIDIYYNEDWRKEDYIGLVSWRFFEKTGLNYQDIASQIKPDVKCYNLSPKKMNDYGHTFCKIGTGDILEICEYFDNKQIVPYKLKYYPIEENAFCNFFVMTPELFESYAKYLLLFMNYFEYDTGTYKFREMMFQLSYGLCKTNCLFFEGLLAIWLKENKIKHNLIQTPAPKQGTLTELAIKYKTDKWGSHYYTGHYEKILNHLRHKPIKLLEIGIGGDENPDAGGESLSMWADYFTTASITGVDVFIKNYRYKQVKVVQCSQTDKTEMEKLGKFDVIIDDGSHMNYDVITTFEFMFRQLNDNGIYIVEDCQTTYFKNHKGADDPTADTMMNYFKKICDGVNHSERQNYVPTYYDKNIIEIRFLHNLIIIFKGENNHKSNIIVK